MEIILSRFTPEYLKEISKQAYKQDRESPECFGNWYKHIIDFGKFKHAEIISNQIFSFEEAEAMREVDDVENVNWEKINEILKPSLDKMEKGKTYNIKNGCFSNKFDFKTCLATKENLAKQLWNINYNSSMFETGGYTELVVREVIENNESPTIYNGMPLREEIRVFYNLDMKKIEYMVDYWDYDYCYENLYDINDKIIFNWFHNKTEERKENHAYKLQELFKRIEDNINTLKFDNELKGIWSIDFLSERNDLYLIDMARGFRSAYWDEAKIESNL